MPWKHRAEKQMFLSVWNANAGPRAGIYIPLKLEASFQSLHFIALALIKEVRTLEYLYFSHPYNVRQATENGYGWHSHVVQSEIIIIIATIH